MAGDEVGDELRPEGDDGRAAPQEHTRQGGPGVFIDRLAVGRLGPAGHARSPRQRGPLASAGRKHEMVHPLKEVGAGLVAHAVGEPAGEGVPLQERLMRRRREFSAS